MAIAADTVDLQSLIQIQLKNNAEQARENEKADRASSENIKDHERKVDEKKRAEHAAQERYEVKGKHDGRQQPRTDAEVLKAQAALQKWFHASNLQTKLPEGQKQALFDALVNKDPQTQQAAFALSRLASQPGVEKLRCEQAFLIQNTLVNQPDAEKNVAQLLQKSHFLHAPPARTDVPTQDVFLGWAMQKQNRNNGKGIQAADGMLTSLVETQTPYFAQAAAMRMAQRNPLNLEGMKTVDTFVQRPPIRTLPAQARGRAVEGLAKADGSPQVADGFERLATHPNFRKQSHSLQAQWFATVGSGRARDMRVLTDATLRALDSKACPSRKDAVSKFLYALGSQAQKKGASGVNVQALLTQASRPLHAPQWKSTAGLSPEEASEARLHNWLQAKKYVHQLGRQYGEVEKHLDQAQFYEDVHKKLPGLTEPEGLDHVALPSEHQEGVMQALAKLTQRRETLLKRQTRLMHQLRQRLPPDKLRRRLAASTQRRVGSQPRFVVPQKLAHNARLGPDLPKTTPVSQAPAGGPETLATSGPRLKSQNFPMPASVPSGYRPRSAGARRPQSRIASGAVAKRMQGADLKTRLQHVPSEKLYQEIAGMLEAREAQVREQIEQVMAQERQHIQEILSELVADRAEASPLHDEDPVHETEGDMTSDVTSDISGGISGKTPGSKKSYVQGKVDKFGIPRSFPKELGGMRMAPVRPVNPSAQQAELGETPPIPSKRVRLELRASHWLHEGVHITPLTQLVEEDVTWKELDTSTRRALQNLGWAQQSWDTRSGTSLWPQQMFKAYEALTPDERHYAEALGLDAVRWDSHRQEQWSLIWRGPNRRSSGRRRRLAEPRTPLVKIHG